MSVNCFTVENKKREQCKGVSESMSFKNKIIEKLKLLNLQNLKSKKRKQEERIEILDFDEPTKYEEPPKKGWTFEHKNIFQLSAVCVGLCFLLLIGASLITGKNVAMIGIKKVLNGVGVYTEEIRNVEMQSSDYNAPGSWRINTSAKWTSSKTAKVTLNVDPRMKTDGRAKDVILVLDISGSMVGEKLSKVVTSSKELVNYLLSNDRNRVAIVTFESSSSMVEGFSNNKEEIFSKLDAIVTDGCTNYNAALQNVATVMEGYIKEDDKDVVTLFLTDGYPNEEAPNQSGTYEMLKDKFPYMTINGIQYEMGNEMIEELTQVTDSQWLANQETISHILFEATVSPITYEKFVMTNYINNDYFNINSVDDIKVTKGTVNLEEEAGNPKITWNLGANSYTTGTPAKMEINVTLKDENVGVDGFYPTNKKQSVTYKLPEGNEQTVNNSSTPVLKNTYEVVYDMNAPAGCTLDPAVKEKHSVYENVAKKTTELSCDGYLFKGWEIDQNDSKGLQKANEDIFTMPEHDVTIRATWTKHSIFKTMDGSVFEGTSLYKVLENEAKEGTYAKEYTDVHQDSFAGTGDKKIYHYYAADTAAATTIQNKNNVIFAGVCWQMIRTTDTGGVKMIYNGNAENNQCLDTRGDHLGYASGEYVTMSSSWWNRQDYIHGTDYTYNASTKTFTLSGTTSTVTLGSADSIGKYTCQSRTSSTCSILYYVEGADDASRVYVLKLDGTSHYSQLGTIPFHKFRSSPADIGYMNSVRYQAATKAEVGTQPSYEYYPDHYIFLKDNANVEAALRRMINADDVNTNNSTIKSAVDAWYAKRLTNYTGYIEDTIYCNNRSVTSLGGWDPSGNKNELLHFKEESTTDLSCNNITDKFSTLNSKAPLKYPIGLITASELKLMGVAADTGWEYWTASPVRFEPEYALAYNSNGETPVSEALGVRPVISLIPGIEYTDGDGSMRSPYLIEPEG